MIQQYGDNAKSCAALEQDMSFITSEVARLAPDTEKTGKNVALGVTGALFLVPLFFMDFSQSEQIEINAYRQRYNHLAILSMEKGCETERRPIEIPVAKRKEVMPTRGTTGS
ncbi:hypothetical protein [Eoetvoesiella caeni]|nr:hypothetical protein [Eoetvoesiella caeni]MCI2811152.1 hypothetical protein [Eoetvoesiella caeni]NYT57213.1 hypothetical protein [Eoetvoesiella caeni]